MKIKKLITGVALAWTLIGSLVAEAANIVSVPSTEVESVYNQAVQSNEVEGWAAGPQIYSESGIVMDIDSGAILYAKNIHDQHYPASITKVLTALVALENNELTDTVQFYQEDIDILYSDYAHIGMKVGEEISMEDALYAVLLASANEVSHAVGSNTEGGYDNFIRLMNEKTKALGGLNSNFVNTNGMHDEEHYTTVYDMALISAAAFQNETFRKITSTNQYTIEATNLTEETRTFQQHHKMLRKNDSRYYEYCVGGKTGYTDAALTTLVTYATKDDVNLVSVVMRTHGGGNNAYVDTRAMLDYGFENFTKVPVTIDMLGSEKYESVVSDSYVMLPSGISFEQLECEIKMPTELGNWRGEFIYTYEGQTVGIVEAVMTEDAYHELFGVEVKETKKEEKTEEKSGLGIGGIILKTLLILLGIVLLAFVGLIGYALYQKKQREKRRRARRRRRRRELERRKRLKELE